MPTMNDANARNLSAHEMLSLVPSIFVVIPAYNEEQSIGSVIEELRPHYKNIVVVDDGSADNTASVSLHARATVLRHVVNRGQGAALQTGIRHALICGAHCIVTFDADGQHRVEDIDALIAPILRGECDFVLGSRFLTSTGQKIPLARRITLWAAIRFTRIVNRLPITDTHNGLRAFSRRAAERIDLQLDRMAHATELLDQIRESGLPYREVAVQVRYTDYSRAKGQSARGAFRIVLHYILGRVLP
jgi:polyprenyl-phospho-N-acetylgalactosaminyl synthase